MQTGSRVPSDFPLEGSWAETLKVSDKLNADLIVLLPLLWLVLLHHILKQRQGRSG